VALSFRVRISDGPLNAIFQLVTAILDVARMRSPAMSGFSPLLGVERTFVRRAKIDFVDPGQTSKRMIRLDRLGWASGLGGTLCAAIGRNCLLGWRRCLRTCAIERVIKIQSGSNLV
jgi:hypothetical protein